MLNNADTFSANTITDKKTFVLNNKFVVQHADIDDLAAVLAIYNQSIAGKQATANLAPVTNAEREQWFADHVTNPKRPIYVVKANTVHSTATIIAWGSFSDLYPRTAYHISSEISIYLHHDYHGQGLGSLLAKWMIVQAPTLGIYNIVALVFAHNKPSLGLFYKLGFEQWGYMPQVCDMQGFIADVVMLGIAVPPIGSTDE